MQRAFLPILNTVLFTIVAPGPVAVYIPYRLSHRFATPEHGPLAWIAMLIIALGALIYFRCAWEFAVRGLGTPAPIAPTRYLVTTAMHRYVRNPMYIGVALPDLRAGAAVSFASRCGVRRVADRALLRRPVRRASAAAAVRRVV